ncbi:MAG: Gfo/Idh/MocA family oxidoreductase [Planctomycetes bacterium]|nr:Gfo/Idh/MocA family oxidoreductase [Planctomycetota bacterium]
MKKVKFAVIGLGYIGNIHLEIISKLENAEVAAVCDRRPDHAQETAAKYGCEFFTDYRKLLEANVCDAVLIATPHYQHTQVGIDALDAGFHVLVEKPISVHKADALRLIAAGKGKKQIFAAMLNQRTDPRYIKIKQLIDGGDLGELVRVNWIITDWFRTDAYYNSGTWRATWAGEGGGVLLNQSVHQLDLLAWLCGMPSKVRGFCGLGKRHNIEVEDEVTAFLDYPNGATGVFITTTGEAPGTNRLEICGDNGKVVAEGDRMTFYRNEVGAEEFKTTCKEGMAAPAVEAIEMTFETADPGHAAIIENFVDAVLNGAELIGPAHEGIDSVELANAILYSSLVGKMIDLPLDAQSYEDKLKQLIADSAAQRA